MSRQSIREMLTRYNPFKWAGVLETKNRNQLPPAIENMCCEVFNPNTLEEIVFHSIHPDQDRMNFFGKGPEHWKTIVCGPGEWAFLPHGLYTAKRRNGQPPNWACTLNFGDNMFRGEKLPSRPEARKIRVFNK